MATQKIACLSAALAMGLSLVGIASTLPMLAWHGAART